MSVLNFKPAIWSKVILAALQKKLVFGSSMVVNNDYEGEISGPGNQVRITQFGDPTVNDYTPNQPITYQTLNDAGLSLIIDQAKYFSFQIDDVDKRQAAGDMQQYLEGRASYKLADAADQFIANQYTNISSANVILGGDGATASSTSNPVTPQPYQLGGASTWHPADFYTMVLEPLKVVLDQNNVPEDGRYIVVPPWAHSLISQTQGFVAVTDASGDASGTMQRGFMGSISGFGNVLKSNNVPQPLAGGPGTGVWAIQAGHAMAITYGEQIAETEALRLQGVFADGVRGLHVYGAKVVRPDCLALAYVKRPAGV